MLDHKEILKPFLTLVLMAMVMAAQFVSPPAMECRADATEMTAPATSDSDPADTAPSAVVMQANDVQAIVPLVKLQLQTAYFLMRQLSSTVLDTAPVPLPLPQYKDIWTEVVFCTAISSQAP